MPAYPPAHTLLAERGALRGALWSCGVPPHEIDDVVSECIAHAWSSIRRGGFLLPPGIDLQVAVGRWLLGIAWRLASHERERARHRREVLTPDPWARAAEQLNVASAVDPERQLIARDALRALLRLPQDRRALLLAAADARPGEIVAALGLSRTAAVARIDEARKALAAALADPSDRRPSTPLGSSRSEVRAPKRRQGRSRRAGS